MTKFIVTCEIRQISDTDKDGNLVLKPVINQIEYAKVFDNAADTSKFLDHIGFPTFGG